MSAKIIVFALVSFLHNLFSAIWMGGLLVTILAFIPAVKTTFGSSPQSQKLMAAFQKKQSLWVYISIAGLIITGLMMGNRSPDFSHLFSFGNPYSTMLSLKHVLVLAMIGISLYRSLILGKRQFPQAARRERLNRRLLMANAVFAIAVLLLSGFTAALG